MLLLKSIASSHSTLGGEILLNLTSSAGSEQVKAWVQMSGKKQGEEDQRGGTGPSTPQKQVPRWWNGQQSIYWTIFWGRHQHHSYLPLILKLQHHIFILFYFGLGLMISRLVSSWGKGGAMIMWWARSSQEIQLPWKPVLLPVVYYCWMAIAQLLCYILEVAALPGLDETIAVNASLAAIPALLGAGPYPLPFVWLCSVREERSIL